MGSDTIPCGYTQTPKIQGTTGQRDTELELGSDTIPWANTQTPKSQGTTGQRQRGMQGVDSDGDVSSVAGSPFEMEATLTTPDVTFVCRLLACLTSQQLARVAQGGICSDSFTYCHTEIEAADPSFYFTQSQCNDTGSTSPSADPRTPCAWQCTHWSTNF